jgi:hypothetical protein
VLRGGTKTRMDKKRNSMLKIAAEGIMRADEVPQPTLLRHIENSA